MVDEDFVIDERVARFSGASWMSLIMPDVFILGCGNIGSWVSLGLSRMNCKVHLFDFDKVEKVNLGCQLYNSNFIGIRKDIATLTISSDFSGSLNINSYGEYKEDSMTNPIIFCCVDSMKIRKLAFEKWKLQEDREIFIDTRNTLELTECFCVTKGNESKYESTLYSDEDANDLPCNLKSTQHCSWIGSALMISCFTNYLSNKNMNENFRIVPFYQSFEIPFFNYEIRE